MKTDPFRMDTVRLSSLARGSALNSARLEPGGDNAFAIDPDRLFEVWLAVADGQPRTERVAVDPSGRCSLHVQRSALFRFPDFIRAEVVSLDDGRSGLSLDSRSRYGISDLGVNGRRIAAWFAELRAALNG